MVGFCEYWWVFSWQHRDSWPCEWLSSGQGKCLKKRRVEIQLGLITAIVETWNTCGYLRLFPADDLCTPPLRWGNRGLSLYASHAEPLRTIFVRSISKHAVVYSISGIKCRRAQDIREPHLRHHIQIPIFNSSWWNKEITDWFIGLLDARTTGLPEASTVYSSAVQLFYILGRIWLMAAEAPCGGCNNNNNN
jgi:hypothetical protein